LELCIKEKEINNNFDPSINEIKREFLYTVAKNGVLHACCFYCNLRDMRYALFVVGPLRVRSYKNIAEELAGENQKISINKIKMNIVTIYRVPIRYIVDTYRFTKKNL
jgi:hypothetical protein